MNRRGLLTTLPLVALAGVTVKVDGTEAQAYELNPEKKYIFVVTGNIPDETGRRCSALLRDRGINATIVAGVEDLKIYELE